MRLGSQAASGVQPKDAGRSLCYLVFQQLHRSLSNLMVMATIYLIKDNRQMVKLVSESWYLPFPAVRSHGNTKRESLPVSWTRRRQKQHQHQHQHQQRWVFQILL
ncbi:hypothetical protein K437DRAFT_151292 [Tilletiaria anomala UBC 951]|uniref:Uncharacterized protein n=1 Tax=Tilletiaria anomala (strain ATCC 24038 / CBS 436.72 / UBC 951) TaxID=1037660 RepID=A0A066VP70_TILAU|nr:uncharacterized protein K437DRAFT_151292 [Tilletiaria anomala UBC 951]KDN43542.1 hypothetical protein K437DRAFT_151292 [Tilletiaria anomala UBC 951]